MHSLAPAPPRLLRGTLGIRRPSPLVLVTLDAPPPPSLTSGEEAVLFVTDVRDR